MNVLLSFRGLHTVNTNACSVRVVSWVTLLFGLCISTSYSAVLFSRLTVDKSDLAIPTLDAVARLKTHVLCVRRHSFAYLLFKVSTCKHRSHDDSLAVTFKLNDDLLAVDWRLFGNIQSNSSCARKNDFFLIATHVFNFVFRSKMYTQVLIF